MAVYSIHAGHAPAGMKGCGAVDILNESAENRIVTYKLCSILQKRGNIVYDDTIEVAGTPQEILDKLVSRINAHGVVDLVLSIHLNSGRMDSAGDVKTGGCEVWGYDTATKSIGERICASIAQALGITNRGYKINPEFYILKHTKCPAIIVECAFVDDRDDANFWDTTKCAEAIADALSSADNKTDAFVSANQLAYTVKSDYSGNSFVDGLITAGIDSSFANRTEIAHANGISEYMGTAEQNIQLLSKLKAGTLKIYK